MADSNHDQEKAVVAQGENVTPETKPVGDVTTAAVNGVDEPEERVSLSTLMAVFVSGFPLPSSSWNRSGAKSLGYANGVGAVG